MVEVRIIRVTERFKKEVSKIKDGKLKEKLGKKIEKIKLNPNFGKPLRYGLRGEWSIYIKPYRLIYKVVGDRLILLRFEHRGKVYKI